MTISPFGWVNNAAPPISAANLEEDRTQIGAYVDAETTRAEAAEDNLIPLSEKGALQGVATLDNVGPYLTLAELPPSVVKASSTAAPLTFSAGTIVNVPLFVPATVYPANFLIQVSGNLYYRNAAGTSGASWGADASNWTEIVGSGGGGGNVIDGVTVSGTPSPGQVITATSTTAADWQTPSYEAITTREFSGTTDTLSSADYGNRVESLSATAVTETVPPLGTNNAIEEAQIGLGQVTFVPELLTPSFVQSSLVQNQGNGTLTSFALTISGVTKCNSLILRNSSGSSGGVGAFTVSDNVGGAWYSAYAPATGAYNSNAFWWCPSSPGGNITITINCPYAPDAEGFAAHAMEWTNLYGVDQTTIASNTGATATTASLTPSQQPELIIAACGTEVAVTSSPASPWNDLPLQTFGANIVPMAYQVVTATTPVTAAWSWTGSEGWAALAISFKGGTRFIAPGVALGNNVQITEQYGTAGLIGRGGNEVLFSGAVTS
jgi:hypothetical protein